MLIYFLDIVKDYCNPENIPVMLSCCLDENGCYTDCHQLHTLKLICFGTSRRVRVRVRVRVCHLIIMAKEQDNYVIVRHTVYTFVYL